MAFFPVFLLDLADDKDKLASSKGKLAQYLCKILDVYYDYHLTAYEIKGTIMIIICMCVYFIW